MSPRKYSLSKSWNIAMVLVCAASLLAAVSIGSAFESAPAGAPGPADGNRFIGVAKCRNCHRGDAIGNQFGKWEKTKHPHAFETLGMDAAKELGKAKGVEDPAKAADCLKCHATEYGVAEDQFAKGFKPEMGVQCESCHGPGERHMKARVAAAAKAAVDEVITVPAGEIIAEPGMHTCLKCHNKESPSYKPFCFRKKLAEIQHLIPTRARTDEERKALGAICGCPEDCTCDGTTVDPACTSAGGK